MSTTFTLSDVIQSHLEEFASGLYTSIPCRVTSVKDLSSKQTIDVEPTVRRVLTNNTYYTLPQLLDVPVIFPSAGGGMLSFPIRTGDTVLVMFSMRSLDEWLSGTGQTVTPFDRRKHSLSDAIAIPGLYTFSSNLSPDKENVTLKFSGSSITMKPNGDVDIDAAGDLNINSAGDTNIDCDGDFNVTATNINLN